MSDRKKQIKYYTNLLKDDEILLLKSCDSFFKNHYSSSPLALLTGFLGSEGEAVIDKNGIITIFVDTRYHLLVDKQVFDDVQIYKMNLGETFFDCIKKMFKKDTVLHVCDDISLKNYLKYDEWFDLRKYSLEKSYLKNTDFNKKAQIFKVDSDVEKLDFAKKVQKLQRVFQKKSKMLIFNLDEISYLTNLRSYQMKYSSLFRAVLYLDFIGGNHILFSDVLPSDVKIDGLRFLNLDDFESFVKSVEDEIWLDLDDICLKHYLIIKKPKEIKNKNLSLLASIRPLSAIEDLLKSFEKLDCAIFNFKNRIKAGLSEYDLSKIFEEEIIKAGACALSFKTIMAVGENSASIHYSQADKNKILKDEDIILLDCGGYFNSGYATDITRTFYFGNKPKTIYKEIYTNVLKAFLTCYLSDITNARKLDKMARDMLAKFSEKGFNFAHGLGHGICTSVHQNPPVLNMKSIDTIKPYQVHSIEPGLYGKTTDGIEFGVRIENCVYSDLNYKKISLSKFPFDELLIDYNLLSQKEKDAVQIWQAGFKNECS
ncbi:M24 family peptidase [bacterium]|nr:M24 family peptidase [bacterium]MBQ9149645.1 M24 family peptidase [bacterium]